MVRIARMVTVVCFVLMCSVAGAQTIDVGRGDVQIRVPTNSGSDTTLGLVVLLHGYSHTGQLRESEWRFGALVDRYGFVLAYPDGTREASDDQNQFWNASDACCNFSGSTVDDSSYVRAIIDRLLSEYNIDPKRVYLIGHSNGGFMSYRLAYEHSETIAAIVSVAGAASTRVRPAPPNPVHVLQIHGTADTVIDYAGGDIRANLSGRGARRPYPGAIASAERWAVYNGCAVEASTGENLDLVRSVDGEETTVMRYTTNCKDGGSSEVWSIVGGAHTPDISPTFSEHIVEWMFAHPKP